MIYIKQDEEISEFDGVDLLIFPLKKDELELLKQSKEDFSKYINLEYDGTDFNDKEMSKIYDITYKKLCDNPEAWVYHTFWVIVSLSMRKIVGTINFKDIPSSLGDVEVGYDISDKYRNNGFCTLALELLINFSKNNNIKKIKACTLKDNIASQKVLDKNFFDKTGEDETYFYFERKI